MDEFKGFFFENDEYSEEVFCIISFANYNYVITFGCDQSKFKSINEEHQRA